VESVKCKAKKGDQREPIPKGNCAKAETRRGIVMGKYPTILCGIK